MINCVLRRCFLPAMMVLVLLVAACGDDDVGPPPNGTDQESTPVLEGAAATFLDLLTHGLDLTYKVTYQTTSLEGDPGDRYVFVSRPPSTKIETIPANSSEPSSLVIENEDSAVSCSGGPAQWECFEMEPLGQSSLFVAGPFVFLSAIDLESSNVSEAEGRTIAAQAARCFLISLQAEPAEEIEYCFSSDGIPLYSAPLFGTVEASEFSLDISDENFTPPAEPQ